MSIKKWGKKKHSGHNPPDRGVELTAAPPKKNIKKIGKTLDIIE